MVANIDDNVGRLLARLAELGLERDTLVVFMNDNGGTVGVKTFNAGMHGAKATPWLGGTRACSFWRWPGAIAPGDRPQLTAHIDFLPHPRGTRGRQTRRQTPRPGRRPQPRPLLENPAAPWPDRTLFTHVGRWPQGSDPAVGKYANCSVRTPRWHLVSEPQKTPTQNSPLPPTGNSSMSPPTRAKMKDVATDPRGSGDQTHRRIRAMVGKRAAATREREKPWAEGEPFKELYWKQFPPTEK
jgi:arylsulfatase